MVDAETVGRGGGGMFCKMAHSGMDIRLFLNILPTCKYPALFLLTGQT